MCIFDELSMLNNINGGVKQSTNGRPKVCWKTSSPYSSRDPEAAGDSWRMRTGHNHMNKQDAITTSFSLPIPIPSVPYLGCLPYAIQSALPCSFGDQNKKFARGKWPRTSPHCHPLHVHVHRSPAYIHRRPTRLVARPTPCLRPPSPHRRPTHCAAQSCRPTSTMCLSATHVRSPRRSSTWSARRSRKLWYVDIEQDIGIQNAY